MDQNNPPATPPSTLPDPQAMVDAALSPTPETPVSTMTTTTTTTEPVTPPAPPVAPAPSMPAMPPMPEPVTPVTPPPAAPEPVTPAMPTPAATTVAMGDDTPLAFVTPPPTSTTTTTTTTTQPVDGATPLPPVPPAPTATEQPKKKSKGKIFAMLLGFLALLGGIGYGGYYYYMNYFGENATIAVVTHIGNNEVVGPESCNGCDGGHEVVWRNGACVQKARLCGGEEEGEATSGNQAQCTGCRGGYNVHWNGSACINGTPCNLNNLDSATECGNNGGSWCSSVDAKGQSYAFCGKTSATKNCNALAAEKGYVIQIGKVSCTCLRENANGSCAQFGGTTELIQSINENPNLSVTTKAEQLEQIDSQCSSGGNFSGAGKEAYICQVGVKGYTGGACTDTNGKKYTGTLGCFCGTVQVDTPNGHTSYTSSCGCNESENDNPPASAPPTAPVMACTGLTYTPTTAPVIGSVLTFTCTGSITPTTAGTLSYKFRSSINNAAPTPLANTTPTTARLTIAACGDYKVECQTCATIAGVLTCDPVWTGATQ